MSALADFRAGFADGWHGFTRLKGKGQIYDHAYDRGQEARLRHEQGGEDIPDTARRKRAS